VANNDLFKISERAFQKRTDFLDLSADIAKLLYSKSSHPKVNGGELYVVHFMDMVHEDESINALGIFKSESKTPFMKVLHKADMYDYEFDEGINLHAIDKACNNHEHLGRRRLPGVHTRPARQRRRSFVLEA
jgi:hypothetical protein